jgi:hypothetical protein
MAAAKQAKRRMEDSKRHGCASSFAPLLKVRIDGAQTLRGLGAAAQAFNA